MHFRWGHPVFPKLHLRRVGTQVVTGARLCFFIQTIEAVAAGDVKDVKLSDKT